MSDYKDYATLFKHIVTNYENPTFLNYLQDNEWTKISIKEFENSVKYLTLAIKEIGLKEKECVAIVSNSSPWWLIMDFAIQFAGGVSVPIFTNISSIHLEHELKDANIKYVFLAVGERYEEFKSFQFEKFITHNIDFDIPNSFSIKDLLILGEKIYKKDQNLFDELLIKIKEDDLLSIIYTSGNTGTPKGVELTHKNIISQLKDTKINFPLDSKNDIALSFLPLAHIFERMVMTYYLSCGISIYFADDVKNVSNLLKTVQPTLMTVVPRVLEKIYSKMKLKIDESSPIKKLLGTLARQRAIKKDPHLPKEFIDRLYTKLVYAKFLEAFGGRVRMLICGGSALDKDLYKFFLNIGLNLYQGYGLTEFSPVISANNPKFNRCGTCGKVFDSVSVKISEDKEILAKGPSLMRGYHNREDLTVEVIDSDGWLHTGDIGTLDIDGYLTILSRKKELFKTSNGKYVSPIPIEQSVTKSKLIDFATVIADNKPYVTALIFPDFEYYEGYKKSHNLDSSYTIDDFFNYEKIKRVLERDIRYANRHLDKWEKIKKYRVITNPISIEGGELTPSMKIRRGNILEKYKEIIEDMYKKEENE